ncbi:DNA-binding protein [Pseudanabaena sp. FACHB-2040]|uniref:DNA-binding protein n=1 Tax=Pseudanabaena sp. FACHB-2040 TaxID=2692859 RepID=UPI001683C7DE|nr:DNA-binding protein [Pseudanabaena sp. FACHB-2040]MBD2259757.1 DNA-binding protein [Pseudanabaena sp. FACHB-2040]
MKALISALFLALATGLPAAYAQVPAENLQQPGSLTLMGDVQTIEGNQFVLSDGAVQTVVNAGPEWHHSIELQPGERVIVVGNYADNRLDAFSITRSNGDIIFIRNAEGPAPWEIDVES